ncbi:MAG TPA: hypothetical protein VFO60_01850 [Candidatus Dormibacteraeota bacterium]|nr:hypothetical protein [Candidatus Dormibacteraeota bacterium]
MKDQERPGRITPEERARVEKLWSDMKAPDGWFCCDTSDVPDAVADQRLEVWYSVTPIPGQPRTSTASYAHRIDGVANGPLSADQAARVVGRLLDLAAWIWKDHGDDRPVPS